MGISTKSGELKLEFGKGDVLVADTDTGLEFYDLKKVGKIGRKGKKADLKAKASMSFANVESLDIVLTKLQELRADLLED